MNSVDMSRNWCVCGCVLVSLENVREIREKRTLLWSFCFNLFIYEHVVIIWSIGKLMFRSLYILGVGFPSFLTEEVHMKTPRWACLAPEKRLRYLIKELNFSSIVICFSVIYIKRRIISKSVSCSRAPVILLIWKN